jgi:hypothetical protein
VKAAVDFPTGNRRVGRSAGKEIRRLAFVLAEIDRE